jgi:hypothetical protein
MRLESWFSHDHAAMGRAMEIESYPGMLACVIAGSGVALMSESMLASLPGRESVAVHPLAEPLPGDHVADVAQGHGRGQPQCLDRTAAGGLSRRRRFRRVRLRELTLVNSDRFSNRSLPI